MENALREECQHFHLVQSNLDRVISAEQARSEALQLQLEASEVACARSALKISQLESQLKSNHSAHREMSVPDYPKSHYQVRCVDLELQIDSLMAQLCCTRLHEASSNLKVEFFQASLDATSSPDSI